MFFIDEEKSLDDRVKNEKITKCLQSKNAKSNDINIIYELYWNQNSVIRINMKAGGHKS